MVFLMGICQRKTPARILPLSCRFCSRMYLDQTRGPRLTMVCIFVQFDLGFCRYRRSFRCLTTHMVFSKVILSISVFKPAHSTQKLLFLPLAQPKFPDLRYFAHILLFAGSLFFQIGLSCWQDLWIWRSLRISFCTSLCLFVVEVQR